MTSVRAEGTWFRNVWVTADGGFRVVAVPTMHETEVEAAVAVADSLVRMDSEHYLLRAMDWAQFGAACLKAGAQEMWPEEYGTEDLDMDSAISAWRATALRGLAVLAEAVACTDDLRGLRMLARASGQLCERMTRRARQRAGL